MPNPTDHTAWCEFVDAYEAMLDQMERTAPRNSTTVAGWRELREEDRRVWERLRAAWRRMGQEPGGAMRR